MQDHLGPQGYQIKIFEGVCGALRYCDPSFDSAPKKLCLLKVEQHFHGLQSVPALLNKSYYCHQCNKGYDHEDAQHHNCSRQNCDKCRRKNGECPDFQEKSLLTSTAMIAVSLFTGKTVLPLTRKNYVVYSKSVRSVVKSISFPRKRSMCAENTDVLTAERKFCRTTSVTFNRLEWSSAIFLTRWTI